MNRLGDQAHRRARYISRIIEVVSANAAVPCGVDHGDDMLAALSSRQPSAFMRVYDGYVEGPYALALRLVGKKEAAEALIEEVFLSLWRDPDAVLSGSRGLQTYLAESVRQRAGGHLAEG